MTPPATASRTHSVLRLTLSIKLSTWAIYRAQSHEYGRACPDVTRKSNTRSNAGMDAPTFPADLVQCD